MSGLINSIISLHDKVFGFVHLKLYFLTALMLRFSLALPFWRSGQQKFAGFRFDPLRDKYQFEPEKFGISENSLYLFQTDWQLPLLSPEVAAFLATVGEIGLPILICLGLFTRFAAAGLLGMTLVIQIFVLPSGYEPHIMWAAIALTLMSFGPGWLSLDHLLKRRSRRAS